MASVFVGSIGIFKSICSTMLQLEIKIKLHMNQENLNFKIGSITNSLHGIGQIFFFILCQIYYLPITYGNVDSKSVNLQCFERYLALLLTLLMFL